MNYLVTDAMKEAGQPSKSFIMKPRPDVYMRISPF